MRLGFFTVDICSGLFTFFASDFFFGIACAICMYTLINYARLIEHCLAIIHAIGLVFYLYYIFFLYNIIIFVVVILFWSFEELIKLEVQIFITDF